MKNHDHARAPGAATSGPARRRRIAAAALLLGLCVAQAGAGPVRSMGTMTFADADTLVVADWRGGELHALQLPPVAPTPARYFNLKDVSGAIARALGTRPETLRFEDMAFRPGSDLAYIGLSVDKGRGLPAPRLVTVDADGKVAVIDPARLKQTSAPIRDLPAADKMLWRDLPQATFSVTDMVYRQGKLYVAGLSNASFASSLRVYDFPFKPGEGKDGGAAMSSIEMYHPVHNQIETRAPIRKMVIVDLAGEPTLVAAFTCSPVVTIPLKDLKDGAHIAAKTIAELGWGSQPVDMVSFDTDAGPTVLLTHSHKAADLMSVADIATAAGKPGITTPIKWPAEPLLGLKSTYIPVTGVAQLSVQGKEFLAALRRNEATGAMELVSMRQGMFLRLSDFVNEYDFAGFKYQPGDGFKGVHHRLRIDEGYADLAEKAGP